MSVHLDATLPSDGSPPRHVSLDQLHAVHAPVSPKISPSTSSALVRNPQHSEEPVRGWAAVSDDEDTPQVLKNVVQAAREALISSPPHPPPAVSEEVRAVSPGVRSAVSSSPEQRNTPAFAGDSSTQNSSLFPTPATANSAANQNASKSPFKGPLASPLAATPPVLLGTPLRLRGHPSPLIPVPSPHRTTPINQRAAQGGDRQDSMDDEILMDTPKVIR